MTLNNKTIANGINKSLRTYKQIEKMYAGDGTRATAMKLFREVYPRYAWYNTNVALITMMKNGYITGLNIENGSIVEPINPVLTQKAFDDIKEKEESLKRMGTDNAV